MIWSKSFKNRIKELGHRVDLNVNNIWQNCGHEIYWSGDWSGGEKDMRIHLQGKRGEWIDDITCAEMVVKDIVE